MKCPLSFSHFFILSSLSLRDLRPQEAVGAGWLIRQGNGRLLDPTSTTALVKWAPPPSPEQKPPPDLATVPAAAAEAAASDAGPAPATAAPPPPEERTAAGAVVAGLRPAPEAAATAAAEVSRPVGATEGAAAEDAAAGGAAAEGTPTKGAAAEGAESKGPETKGAAAEGAESKGPETKGAASEGPSAEGPGAALNAALLSKEAAPAAAQWRRVGLPEVSTASLPCALALFSFHYTKSQSGGPRFYLCINNFDPSLACLPGCLPTSHHHPWRWCVWCYRPMAPSYETAFLSTTLNWSVLPLCAKHIAPLPHPIFHPF